MSSDRRYPDAASGPFPRPPLECRDEDGRPVSIEVFDGPRSELVEMYADFDPADRAQGIPPVGEERIRDWLDHLLCEDCYNVVAVHDGDIVGHATLVGDDDNSYELAIFVHQEFQGGGIGTQLLECLLGYGADLGIDRVWLTVERWNRTAINLYKKVGFETANAQNFEHEMSIRLQDDSAQTDSAE